jgi:hypothetical protein
MSNLPPGGEFPDEPYPNEWQGGDTGNVPLGPEPEPTYAGGAGGSGGWGDEPRTEPFAIAALVWAIVSIVIPIIGTIVAFVLAQRAADSIRRSQGTRKGEQLVTAARITAGAVLGLWAIGLVSFFALRGGDSKNSSDVAVPTQPPVSTTLAPVTTVTTVPITTTTTKPPVTTTAPPPTVTVVPPPSTLAPTTVAPTTAAPTTTPPTTAPPTTKPPTSTTIPDSQKSDVLAQKMLARAQLGPSNRHVPDDERFQVDYQAGQVLTVTWAINNGAPPLPTGTATCTVPPPSTTTTTTVPGSTTTTSTTTSTTSTTTPGATTTTTTLPAGQRTTSDESRYEARQILLVIKGQISALKLDFTEVQVIGTYPITGSGEDAVAEVLYPHSAVQNVFTNYKKAFDVPPASAVQCLNPAFESS